MKMDADVFDLGAAASENCGLLALLDPWGTQGNSNEPRVEALTEVPAGQNAEDFIDAVNIKELADKIAIHCAALTDPASFHPAYFIRTRIEDTARALVTAPKELAQITYDAIIPVKYLEHDAVNRSDSLKPEKPPAKWRQKNFTLAEICTDHHLVVLKEHGYKEILWPSFYPKALIEAFLDANYQDDFKQYVRDNLLPDGARVFGNYLKRTELIKLVVEFIKDEKQSVDDRQIAFAFLKGTLTPRTLFLHSDPSLPVDNAVFIGADNLAKGILFFLGEDRQAMVFPAGHDARGAFLESNARLQTLLLKRVSLRAQQQAHVRDFKYRGREMPLFATRPHYRELVFKPSSNIGRSLYELQVVRAWADIDTLVSTSEERITDLALEAAGHVLQCLALAASMPWGGSGVLASTSVKVLVSLLVGLGAASTDLIRAEIADDPAETDRLRISAAIGVLAELAGPVGERLIGKALSAAAKKRLSQRILNTLGQANRPSLLRRPGGTLSHHLASTAGKEIPDVAKGAVVAGQLQELAGGPSVAQLIANETQLVRHAGPQKGFVYQGFTFRGDTRDPSIIFKEGFRQRTPITDLNQVNGFKGGYGGAHDALAPDGAGISTSAFYKKDGAGAFVYGGAKGGHTYFIDARQLEGFHLYANTELAFRPNSGLKILPPLEINYAVDISPRLILGAYDSAGKFIPNPQALRSAIQASQNGVSNGFGRDLAKKVGGAADQMIPTEGLAYGNEAGVE
ncbi:hypothetical protein [Pseudomonas sp. MWU318]|uniref:hypothetical protein n=1 Tax=Pseudomonas sp. MWU318 TaxID=2802569 RepID=UPI001928DBA8|nr:hypothetical protein [Pseudomonas sp. MWU318]